MDRDHKSAKRCENLLIYILVIYQTSIKNSLHIKNLIENVFNFYKIHEIRTSINETSQSDKFLPTLQHPQIQLSLCAPPNTYALTQGSLFEGLRPHFTLFNRFLFFLFIKQIRQFYACFLFSSGLIFLFLLCIFKTFSLYFVLFMIP